MRLLRMSLLVVFLAGNLVQAAKKKPCFQPLSKCPTIGCAHAGSREALSNSVKRRKPPSGDAEALTFKDFRDLQTAVEDKLQKLGIPLSNLIKTDRKRLKNLKVGQKTIGEGDLVEVTGFIAITPAGTKPHANSGGESVNCRIPGSDDNDFHISITEQLGSEFQGIVVEMIPQKRPANWTEKQLKVVQSEKRRVRVRGGLYFDDHHKVNTGGNPKLSKQPKRMSLWEIHPVKSFEVCTKATCSANGPGWKSLEDWQEGGNP